MSDIAVRVENLSKLYRIGQFVGYRTLREDLMDALTAPFRKQQLGDNLADRTIWALKDVSFEVERGEIVGIIGRNGAGKSTLLKVLTRITEPTEGYAEIRGRVGSLLEVGTGFHPELTGRENIYLNGAVLGMKKKEISRKFAEIVEFSGVEKFIDTPLKRYSSGMQVRLAFAIAAHLEPEILLVDEVLAVGDAEFQKKSIGKMSEIAQGGRTVLFVSHNLSAIQQLCTSAYLLEDGTISSSGNTIDVINKYHQSTGTTIETAIRKREIPKDSVNYLSWELEPSSIGAHQCFTGEPCNFRFQLDCKRTVKQANFGFALWAADGSLVWAMRNLDYGGQCVMLRDGKYELEFFIPSLPIRPGLYQIHVSVNDLTEGTLESWYAEPKLTVLPKDESGLPPQWQGIVNIGGRFHINEIS
jgi:lipopolysaccharide transport system ATP-binding protein